MIQVKIIVIMLKLKRVVVEEEVVKFVDLVYKMAAKILILLKNRKIV